MNKALEALTKAVLALPCISIAQDTDIGDIEWNFGYRHHDYKEKPLSKNKSAGEQLSRYDIDVNQFHIAADWNDSASISLDYQREVMSGASPWFTSKNESGDIVQVMSGASIFDTRTDVQLKGAYNNQLGRLGAVTALSNEDDYRSLSFGAELSKDFNNKLTTISIAGDFSNDDINPTDSEIYPTRPDSESKHSTSFLVSLSQVINQKSMAQFSIGYIRNSGFLSDPYKLVQIGFELKGDSRPKRKVAKTLSVRYRYFLTELDSALHFDYRYYWNDWKVKSHTFDLNYVQPLPWETMLKLGVRLYNQDSSFFYQHFYEQERVDGYYSTDYRLSEYGVVSYRLDIAKSLNNITLHASVMRYQSGGNKGLSNANSENPALLDFDLISLGFDYKF